MLAVREAVRGWRFYDHFRTDSDSPARIAQIGTFTPVLHHDGSNLAAALQTIMEIRSDDALATTLEDAFPKSRLYVEDRNGRFELQLQQHGLLRPLSAAELSDGTLRYLLWTAALLTPRPPELMVSERTGDQPASRFAACTRQADSGCGVTDTNRCGLTRSGTHRSVNGRAALYPPAS